MHRARWVLLISGMLGFRVGMIGFPDWQVAVETSQVVAGLVDYPAGNPFFIYHTKLWTILHQIVRAVAVGRRVRDSPVADHQRRCWGW